MHADPSPRVNKSQIYTIVFQLEPKSLRSKLINHVLATVLTFAVDITSVWN